MLDKENQVIFRVSEFQLISCILLLKVFFFFKVVKGYLTRKCFFKINYLEFIFLSLIVRIRLMFEQKELYKSIEEKMRMFDAELKMLRHDRARIAIFMKNADLR